MEVLSAFFQWVHIVSSVLVIGGYAFLLLALLPSTRRLNPDQGDLLLLAIFGRFRWIVWAVIFALFGSGLYNTHLAWEAPWGTYWKLLTLKIFLSFVFFGVSLCLTLPFSVCKRFRFRRETLLAIALGLAGVVLLISTYLRRG